MKVKITYEELEKLMTAERFQMEGHTEETLSVIRAVHHSHWIYEGFAMEEKFKLRWTNGKEVQGEEVKGLEEERLLTFSELSLIELKTPPIVPCYDWHRFDKIFALSDKKSIIFDVFKINGRGSCLQVPLEPIQRLIQAPWLEGTDARLTKRYDSPQSIAPSATLHVGRKILTVRFFYFSARPMR